MNGLHLTSPVVINIVGIIALIAVLFILWQFIKRP